MSDVFALIVGGGKFGLKAAGILKEEGKNFLVFDQDPDCLAAKAGINVLSMEKLPEAIEKYGPELIFPTAPIHVAAEILRLKFRFKPWIEVVDCIISGFPPKVIVSAGRGGVVVSYNRDMDCLENCRSPDICPVTKIKKPCPMFELVRFAYPCYLLVSHQIKPGIGAIRGEDVLKLLKEAEKRKEIVVATACRCHGVVTALKKI